MLTITQHICSMKNKTNRLQVNIDEQSMHGKIIDAGRTNSCVLDSEITELILQNFYTVYKNNWWLKCWNQNCDISIRFWTPAWRNDDSQISAESQHNYGFLPLFNSKTNRPIFAVFLHAAGEYGGTINERIQKTTLHSILERKSKEWRRPILTFTNNSQS